MSYRRNKSHKVPNVKLRPAVPASSASSSTSKNGSKRILRKDSGFDSEGDADTSSLYSGDVCPRPFKGVVLCATGISDKTSLFKQAIELGAQSISDLTDKVTHVIAERPGSDKYNCALDHGIPIMHPRWITESYTIWLRGDDVDLRESVAKYRLPIFNDVVVTLTGIPSIERRMEINKLINKHGGKYLKNLERPVKVTHMLCSRDDPETNGEEGLQERSSAPLEPDVSEKLVYAQKFNDRGEASIHIVWEEWFWDCLTYGGRFNEEGYLVTKPRPKRKEGPQAISESQVNTSIPVEISMEPSSSNPQPEPHSARAQNHASHANEEEEETASVKRIPDVKLGIWHALMNSRGFEVSQGRLIRSPSKSQAARQSQAGQQEAEDDGFSATFKSRMAHDAKGKKSAAGGSLLASLHRSKSFAPASKDTSTQKGKQPFQRVATQGVTSSEDAFWGVPGGAVGPILAQGGLDVPVASGSRTPPPAVGRESSFMTAGSSRINGAYTTVKSGIFSNATFRALGEARCTSVKAAIEEAGGMIVDDEDAEVDYIVVRLASGSKLFREEADESQRGKYRTECWLERCIYEERICDPDEHITLTPLSIEPPITGAEGVNLSFSGLDQSEATWMRRLTRALGIAEAPAFSRRTTHLLCPSMSGAKFEKAHEWSIPVVDMSWIEHIARHGVVPDLVSEEEVPPGLSSPRAAELAATQAESNGRRNKGKSKDVALAMADITNNDPPPVDEPPDEQIGASRTPSPLRVMDEPESLFGPPGTLLSHNMPSSPGMPPDEPATSPPRSRATTAEPHSTPSHRESNPVDGVSRQQTLQELREDMLQTRIPSSSSPSPLKPPSHGAAVGKSRSFGHSPLRISKEASRVLQDSITTLLGKRQPSEDDLVNGGRGGKRARPMVRTKSKQDQPLPPPRIPSPAPASKADFNPFALDDGEEDISMLAAEGPASEDQSMRVTYEDPNQNDERQRLIRLLETQQKEIWEVDDDDQPELPIPKPVQSSSSLSRKGSRKTARNPGF